MSDNELILNAINTIREANDNSHNDLRDRIHEGLRGIQLVMEANAEVTNKSIRVLADKQQVQNGNVARLQGESNARKADVENLQRFEQSISGYKKKWLYILAGAVGFVLAIVVLYDMIGMSGIIELVKGVR